MKANLTAKNIFKNKMKYFLQKKINNFKTIFIKLKLLKIFYKQTNQKKKK